MNEIKVSIVMPSLNVAKYINQCVDSVLNQTLKEIEVIFVDAGSTDGTLEILQDYVKKDERCRLINSDKKSYGYQMNLGFDAAQGEYLGIIETDDYADPDMFEKLYACAKKDDLDVAKSGFYYYFSKPEESNTPSPIASRIMCNRVFCPTTDFKSKYEQAEFFNIKPTIWSAIYKHDFILKNKIRFHETAGASYQDASFNFKVFACAERVRLLEECFLHYRQDNESSSINSPGKVYCISDEYEEMERFLNEHPVLKAKLEKVRVRLKYDSYIWNYERLSEDLQLEFIQFASEDFKKDMAMGYCDKKYFPWYKWNTMMWIIETPLKFHEWKQAEKEGRPYESPVTENGFGEKLKNKLVGGYYCWREHGFFYTLKNLCNKIKRKVGAR